MYYEQTLSSADLIMRHVLLERLKGQPTITQAIFDKAMAKLKKDIQIAG